MATGITSRAERKEREKWVLFLRALLEANPSAAVLEAGRMVFGGASAGAGPAGKMPKPLKATPEILIRKVQRQLILSGFKVTYTAVSDAAVYKAVRVDKTDWYRWRRGELPDSSGKTQRIESYLGAGPIRAKDL